MEAREEELRSKSLKVQSPYRQQHHGSDREQDHLRAAATATPNLLASRCGRFSMPTACTMRMQPPKQRPSRAQAAPKPR